MSIDALADRYGVGERTVHQALKSPNPQPRKQIPAARVPARPVYPEQGLRAGEEIDAGWGWKMPEPDGKYSLGARNGHLALSGYPALDLPCV